MHGVTNVTTKLFIDEYSNSLVTQSAVIKVIERTLSKNITTLNLILSPMKKAQEEAEDLINGILRQNITKTIAVRLEEVEKLKEIEVKRFFNVFFVDSFVSFIKMSDVLIPELFHFQGKFLIVLMRPMENNLFEIDKMFQVLWKMHIVNINILVRSKTTSDTELYTYFPYTDSYCSEVHTILWKTFRNNQFEDHESFYPNKMTNLHNCPLRVVVFDCNFITVRKLADGSIETTGLDAEILQILSQNMNFKVKHIYLDPNSAKWGILLANGSNSGAMKYVCIII